MVFSPPFVEETGFVQKRILVVDDNPEMLKLIRLFVNSDPDFQVCGEAFDGLDAVERAMELKIVRLFCAMTDERFSFLWLRIPKVANFR